MLKWRQSTNQDFLLSAYNLSFKILQSNHLFVDSDIWTRSPKYLRSTAFFYDGETIEFVSRKERVLKEVEET